MIKKVIKPKPSKSLLGSMSKQSDDADHRRNPARHLGETKGKKAQRS